jgi:RHS repeat-associated protein
VKEKRSYDDDGRRTFRTRNSDVIGLLVSDSLDYDRMGRIRRAWQLVRQQSADQTLISYDGLGAVVAKEQGNELGSSVEEFRNDAFGNVLRRLTRKSAGDINNAPFAMTYGFNGALLGVVAQLKSPPEGIYQKEDNLAQGFTSGRMTRQGQIVRNPNNGVVEHQVAARHYFGADDRLMAVQRYSWRGQEYRDGTWEEYRYDALGRRIATRVRRHDTTAPYAGNVSGPLCQSTTPVCRSYTERVWWDGDTDQALYESRTPDGIADVSNDDYVGNIHGLTLDEPLAVISHRAGNVTRIINYNWRGQGLSSVFPDGSGADYATGSTSAEVDWPAATQRETYFTPAPELAPNNTPKKWLGTFVQSGMGTTGMLYRRNRYFDTKSGRFTQEDPTGIVTGLNVYGFAEGDPVNFSDPFGLCTPWPDCMLQAAANWGARQAGALGSAVTTGAAAANAASAVLGINDFGKAVAERDAVGIGFGFASIIPIGRAGAVGKAALSALMKDAARNPGSWRTIGVFTEAATRKGLRGGLSIQSVIENQAGERLVQHTLLGKHGNLIEQHFRPMYKPRAVDVP